MTAARKLKAVPAEPDPTAPARAEPAETLLRIGELRAAINRNLADQDTARENIAHTANELEAVKASLANTPALERRKVRERIGTLRST